MDANIIAILGAAALGVVSLILTKSKTLTQKNLVDTEIPDEEDREFPLSNTNNNHQEKYDSLTKELLIRSETLRKTQEILADCYLSRRRDALKIVQLQAIIDRQVAQIKSLEQRPSSK